MLMQLILVHIKIHTLYNFCAIPVFIYFIILIANKKAKISKQNKIKKLAIVELNVSPMLLVVL